MRIIKDPEKLTIRKSGYVEFHVNIQQDSTNLKYCITRQKLSVLEFRYFKPFIFLFVFFHNFVWNALCVVIIHELLLTIQWHMAEWKAYTMWEWVNKKQFPRKNDLTRKWLKCFAQRLAHDRCLAAVGRGETRGCTEAVRVQRWKPAPCKWALLWFYSVTSGLSHELWIIQDVTFKNTGTKLGLKRKVLVYKVIKNI